MAGAVGLVFLLGTGVSVVETQKSGFCLSCHEMQLYQKELDASPHAKDAEGRPIGCSQCHVPGANIVRMLAGKSYMGGKDLWVHYAEGPVALHRAAVQPAARRFFFFSFCRVCHEDLAKNVKNDGPVSAEGKLAHDAYLGTNGQARSGCAGCHANMAHLPPFDERIPRNAKFLSKLKESQP
ncbi:MAG: NapC/NirT family cytochrome c [Deltaproteobacteria bacterium]|jgi:nitrate/TMAO reductase-like tetraheme cytochrome c subunit|nr:NapC/NirT family cytochrome c [Deltaproteobacteria bacterium]